MHVPLHKDKYLTIVWNWDQSFIVQLISEYLATLLTFLSSCSLFTYVLCQKRQSSVCNALYENKIYSSSLHILESTAQHNSKAYPERVIKLIIQIE